MYNKDFYAFLPKYLEKVCDEIIDNYSDKPWFREAWEEYRHLARSLNSRHLPMPYKFFGEKDTEYKVKQNDIQPVETVDEEIQKNYEKNFKPTVQEEVKKEFNYERQNKKDFKKNKRVYY